MALKDLVLPPWEDPDVQIVYETLCETGKPPGDDHWEGWVARHIVYALRRRAEIDAPVTQQSDYEAQKQSQSKTS
jgi:hypothetical protein